jgi:phage terminase large subunit-like protein
MNIPEGNKDVQVTEWENILATNKPIPDLTGKDCTVGIDYASISDMCSVNFHFKDGDKRYDISHAWLCLNSADITRIKAPWREWAKDELITLVDDVEISPDLITSYIQELGAKYNILGLALDNYRYALLANSLRKIGFDAKEYKNVHMIRPSDIMKTVPVVGSYFANHNFIWGDNSPLRWATNNTKLVRAGKTQGTDTGNYYFCKVEGRSRKTDSFLALVASIVIEDRMGDGEVSVPDLPVFTY